MKFYSQLLRQISYCEPPWLLRRHSTAATSQLVTAEEVLTILKSSDPMERALEPILPFLSPDIVSSIIKNPPNQQLGLRFFIWASKYERFLCPESPAQEDLSESESASWLSTFLSE